MNRILFFCPFVLSALCLPVFVHRLTKGFKVAKMEFSLPYHPEWDVPMEAMEILNQPFSYLGKGVQSYVFESEDGKYVVKFFRSDASEEKILSLFNACKIAYDELKEETGLLYLHLNATSQRFPVLKCTDPIGRVRKLPLDRYRFAIQKKAQPFRKTLEEAMEDPELMQRRIDQFIALLVSRAEKGIVNTDPNLSRNFGFLDDRAIEIDFGNYERGVSSKEVKRYTGQLHRWLLKRSLKWAEYLEQRVP